MTPRAVVLQRLAFGAMSGAALAGLALVAALFPYHRDDRELDHVVRLAALDWRDFGEARARSRLYYELDRAEVGMWVGDEDCELVVTGDDRIVRCAWRVDLEIPGMDVSVPVRFSSAAAVGRDGDLR